MRGKKKLTHTKESRQKYQTDIEKINCKIGKKGKQKKIMKFNIGETWNWGYL